MDLTLIPLGTASAIPTRQRHMSSVALLRAGRMLLFDCGEGTQQRLIDAGLKRTRVETVCITHLHGDHFFGLPGLLATLDLLQRTEPLTVLGPPPIRSVLEAIPGTGPEVSYPLEIIEIEEPEIDVPVLETSELLIYALPVEHRTETLAFRVEERPRPGRLDVEAARALGVTEGEDYGRLKAGETVRTSDGQMVEPDAVIGPERPGRTVAYVIDTRPCANGRRIAEGADLLYHEATFLEEHAERAVATAHSTAREAAEIARDAGCERLLLGHFSARYQDLRPLQEEARAIFKNTEVARELKRYAI